MHSQEIAKIQSRLGYVEEEVEGEDPDMENPLNIGAAIKQLLRFDFHGNILERVFFPLLLVTILVSYFFMIYELVAHAGDSVTEATVELEGKYSFPTIGVCVHPAYGMNLQVR